MGKYVDENSLFGNSKVEYVNEDDFWGKDESVPTLKATPKQKVVDPLDDARDSFGIDTPPNPTAPDYGDRSDGSAKGKGYFGELKNAKGQPMTEYSIGVNLDGEELEIPSLVPTLTQPEVDHILKGGKPTESIVKKATAHARDRISQGRDPFAQDGENSSKPLPQNENLAEDLATKLNSGATVGTPKFIMGGLRQAARSAIMSGHGTDNPFLDNPTDINQYEQNSRTVERKYLDPVSKRLVSRGDTLSSQYSPEMQRADKTEWVGEEPQAFLKSQQEGFVDTPESFRGGYTAGNVFEDPTMVVYKGLGGTVESLPESISTMGPTAFFARQAGKKAIMRAAAYITDKAELQKIGEVAAERTAALIGAGSEGMQGKDAAYEDAYLSTMETDVKDLAANPVYLNALKNTPQDLPIAEREDLAKRSMAHLNASIAGGVAFAFDAPFAFVGDRYLGSAAMGKGTRTGSLIKGGVSEGFTEMPQSWGEKVGENLGARATIDPNRPVLKDAGEAGIIGFVSGFGMGVGMGGGVHNSEPKGPLSRAANIATENDVGVPVEEPIPGVDHSLYTHVDQEGRPYRPVGPGAVVDGTTEDYMPDWYADRVYPKGWLDIDPEDVDAGSSPGTEESVQPTEPVVAPETPLAPDTATDEDESTPQRTMRALSEEETLALADVAPHALDPSIQTATTQDGETAYRVLDSQGNPAYGWGVLEDVAPADKVATDAATHPENNLPEPTTAQQEAGNYQKAHVRLNGMDISIENPAGSTREGVDENGNPWETNLSDHYGYIKGTIGKDKDHIDVFIPEGYKPSPKDRVAVIDQIDPKTGKLDEHKVVMGAKNVAEARKIYLRNYDATGPDRIGAITMMPMEQFRKWSTGPKTHKPVAKTLSIPSQKIDTPDASAPASAPKGVTSPEPVVSRDQGVSETQTGLPITDESQTEPTDVAPVKHDLTGVKVQVRALLPDGKVGTYEQDAQTALNDIDTEISLYEKILDCVMK
jgi:hypothetical protein